MATYKYRHQEIYKDVSIDIKAKSSGELIDKVKKKKDQIDRQYMDKDTTLGDFIDKYLETYKQHTVAPDTYNYCESLGRKISDGIGSGRKVSKIKPMQVQSFLNELTDYKDSYIKKIYQMTCRIFQHAYRNGLTTTDYSVVLELPKGRKAEIGRSLTDHEREILLQVLPGHRGELFCKLMLYCGLRPGEVMALQWKDVDLRSETISVDKSYKRSGYVAEPKTQAAVRSVPVPHHLVQLLQQHQGEPFDRVCPFNEGQRRAMWKSVKRAMNIAMGCRVFNNALVPPFPLDEKFDMYYLRHTYCTDLERAGVPINVARRLMGHSNITITSKIYTHDNAESMEAARDLINGALGKQTGNNPGKRCG